MAANDKGSTFFDMEIPSLSNALINAEIIKAKIAKEIISRRKELKMNQSEFANHMNVSQAMVSKWENGDCNFSLSTICEICDKLALSIDLVISKPEHYKCAPVTTNWNGITYDTYETINPIRYNFEEMVA